MATLAVTRRFDLTDEQWARLAPLLPLTALLYLLMTVDSAVRHHLGQGAAWKGRTYARPSAAP